jgi:hypothetical protein
MNDELFFEENQEDEDDFLVDFYPGMYGYQTVDEYLEHIDKD